ncbi:uncharacterized protein LOC112047733 [Bicyclus anynana]|uniref:Uncharacterized protein LOC112047733 n=1 Tax=Bicyclus anynana TaxID=110368 RepID=A0ABM3LYI4_BICAN|nr:uncharacterized protein LOC112047733 [Bicyclus anynana]
MYQLVSGAANPRSTRVARPPALRDRQKLAEEPNSGGLGDRMEERWTVVADCDWLSVIQPDHPPLAAELSSRVAARASRLMQDSGDPRLGFPSMQELAAIKKVAETLIMLGQEVIPSIIGEIPIGVIGASPSPVEVPNDPVGNN